MKKFAFQLILILGAGGPPALADSGAELQSGLAAMEAGKFAEAKSYFLKARAHDPKNGLILFNLGTAEFNLKSYAAAADAFRQVIDMNSPLAPAARLYLAKSLRKSGDLVSSAQTLQALESDALLPESHIEQEKTELHKEQVRLALIQYRQSHYAKVLDYVGQDFQTSSAHLLRGLVHLKLGKIQEASDSFRTALALPNEGDSHTQARFFLDQLTSRQVDAPVWAYGDLGLGYNSNLFLDGKSESPVGRFTTQLNAAVGVQWREARPWIVSAAYGLYWEETPGAASGRFLANTFRAPLGLNTESWLVQFTPAIQFQTLETQPYLLRAGVAAQIRKRWEDFNVALSYDWNKQFAQVSGASYLDGRVTNAAFTVGYLLGQSYLEAGLLVAVDDIGDLVAIDATLPLAGKGVGPQLRGVWYPSASSEVEIAIAHISRSYRRLAEPGGVVRSDTQQRANIRFLTSFAANLRGFFNCSVLWNVSTLDSTSLIDDKNFTQVITMAGVSWDILN